jgi:hypothetical protein
MFVLVLLASGKKGKKFLIARGRLLRSLLSKKNVRKTKSKKSKFLPLFALMLLVAVFYRGDSKSTKLLMFMQENQCDGDYFEGWLNSHKYPPIAPRDVLVPVHLKISTMSDNLILGVISGYELEMIKPFLDSYLISNVSAKLVLIGISKDENDVFNSAIRQYAGAYDIALETYGQKEMKNVRLFSSENGLKESFF